VKVSAANKDDALRYEIYLDGVNVSNVVTQADDVAHQVVFVIRTPDGNVLRRADGKALTVKGDGHVAIVSKINEPALNHAP
jgi:hypothetical protein